MKRRSALDSLRTVRKVAQDAQRAILGNRVRSERQAVEHGETVAARLETARQNGISRRRIEAHRLAQEGIFASEGCRADAWRSQMRADLGLLSRELRTSLEAVSEAKKRTRETQQALSRASAEVDQVQRRLDQRKHAVALQRERDAYNAQDDATLHRLLHRMKAST